MELLEKGWEIRRNWSVGIDEDLTMEERRVRWRLVKRTRKERAKSKVVVTTNRRIWESVGIGQRKKWVGEMAGETEENSTIRKGERGEAGQGKNGGRRDRIDGKVKGR